MSVSYSVKVGPYIELSNLSTDSTKDIIACLNKSCLENTKPASGKFCANCGDKLYPVKLTQKNKVSSSEVLDDYIKDIDFYDHDAENGCYYFYDNNRVDDIYFGEVVEIVPDDIKENLMEFTRDYGDIITRLKEVFGEDFVTVSYGIITYAG